jgi:hypothetical protein
LITSAMKLLLIITLPWAPARGSNFSTYGMMRAGLLFESCIGATRGNLRHRNHIDEK